MDSKSTVITHSLWFILLILLILGFSGAILKVWGDTNRCQSIQSICAGVRFSYCSEWIQKKAQPDWPEGVKTCGFENVKKEVDCAQPETEKECQIIAAGGTCKMDTTKASGMCTSDCKPINNRYVYCKCDTGFDDCNINEYHCSIIPLNGAWPTYDCGP
jgi:hypothetical protein